MEERLFGDESSLNGFYILLLPRPHVSFSLHADIAVGPNSISPSFLNVVVQPTKAYSYISTLKIFSGLLLWRVYYYYPGEPPKCHLKALCIDKYFERGDSSFHDLFSYFYFQDACRHMFTYWYFQKLFFFAWLFHTRFCIIKDLPENIITSHNLLLLDN